MKFWSNTQSRLPELERPMDWQDKLVVWASAITGAICLAIVIWGR